MQSTSDPPFINLVNLVWRKSQQTKKDSAAAKKKEKVGANDGETETSIQNLIEQQVSAKDGEKEAEKEGEKKDGNTSQVGSNF